MGISVPLFLAIASVLLTCSGKVLESYLCTLVYSVHSISSVVSHTIAIEPWSPSVTLILLSFTHFVVTVFALFIVMLLQSFTYICRQSACCVHIFCSQLGQVMKQILRSKVMKR